MPSQVQTAFPLRIVRWDPVGMDPAIANLFEESGAVDYVSAPDVLGLTSFVPPQIERLTPPEAPDNSSWYDPAIALGVVAVKHPKLGVIHGGVNAIRNGPAELFRAGMTLANLTEGRAMCWVSVGELYNVKPFGYKRSEGLARFEDHFRLYNLLWERDTPFDFQGNVWKFESAYIGGARGHRPEMWAMGGGPRLIGIAANYADGWVTCVPMAAANPEAFAERVKTVREAVERAGRDPDAFGIAIMPNCLIHEDEEVIRNSYKSPMIRFLAALWGRSPQINWRAEGLQPPLPEGYEYSVRFDSLKLTDEDFAGILARTPDEMVEKSYVSGSPKQVTDQLQAYVDAGATLVQPVDLLSLGRGTWGDAFESDTIRWRMNIYRDLKGLGK